MRNIITLFFILLSVATTAQQQTINNGESGAVVRGKINSNFTDLYTNKVSLTGTQLLTNKTMSGAANTFSNIPANAILAGDTEEFDPASKLNVNNPTVTGTLTTPLLKITSGSPGAGKVATSDADGDVTWETPSSGGTQGSIRATKFEFFTDFVNALISNGSGIVGSNELAMITSGAGATSSVSTTGATANRPGVVAFTTGTTNAGYVAAFGASGLRAAGGAMVYEVAVRVPTLSTSGERFVISLGFVSDIVSITQLDAMAFVYDEGGVGTGSAASANWQLVTANNNTRTYTTSSIAVATNTWQKLRIEVNAAGTSVQFFVDGVSAGSPITTNIPTGRNLPLCAAIFKSVGTTARIVDLDYLLGEITFTTPR